MRGTRFLIFDEPTAYLTRQESAQLFKLIRRLQGEGVTIVYISHRMEEVFELADRVSVLRDGTHVGTRKIGDTNEAELITLMINRSIEQIYHKEEIPFGETILDVRSLSGPVSGHLAVRPGGRDRRSLWADRCRVEANSPSGSTDASRSPPAKSSGMVARSTSATNGPRWISASLWHPRAAATRAYASTCRSALTSTCRCIAVSVADQPSAATRNRECRPPDPNLKIKTPTRAVLASTMSGGNQQKIVIGKWLSHGAKLFIFDEPTVGVDVGTKAEIYRLMAALLRQGAGIILISSYLPEVYELADRLHVFRQGRLVATHDFRGRVS